MPRKPPPPKSTSEEELVAATFLADLESVAGRIAQAEGEPPGSQPMGDADKVRLWGIQDRRVDPSMLLRTLLSTGLGQEATQMTIVAERPELLDAYAQPATDPEVAQQLVTLAQYPFRLGVVSYLEDDLEAWVRESERIDRLWQQAGVPTEAPAPLGAPADPLTLSAPATPAAPTMPAPQMPEAAPPAPALPVPAEIGG